MTGTASAIPVLFFALACGCASAPDKLDDLRSTDQEKRLDAARELADRYREGRSEYVAARRAIAAELRRLLDDRSALVRGVAVDSLARVEGLAAAGPIADRLRDKDRSVRYTAVKRLGWLKARAAAPAIAELLRTDESMDVRRASAQALAAIRPPGVLHDLYIALEDDSHESRYAGVPHAAYLALRSITGKDLGEDARAWRAAIGGGR